jgi:hypothetical protein
MNKQSRGMKFAGTALLALAALQISAFDAFAAKEKFTRSKPHVNVGTTGPSSSQSTADGMTATPSTDGQPPADCEPDPARAAETSRPPCPPAD